MFRLYTRERFGTRAITTTLTERGITTAAGKARSSLQVGHILANPAYAGVAEALSGTERRALRELNRGLSVPKTHGP
jgi:hypothetical protein